jgi:hypothetical protein
MIRSLVFAAILLACTPVFSDEDVIGHLQDISATVLSDNTSGSGVCFTRKDGGDSRTFCWTAAHVIAPLRKTREVIINGATKTSVEFSDAVILNDLYENGRRVGETRFEAKVVKYSDADRGDDLALLEVRKRNFLPLDCSVEFYAGTPKIGAHLLHVGSLLGQMGSNSLTGGILSRVGRVIEDLGPDGKVFDQVQCTSMPGSSGGGVFEESSGKCIGLLVRGAGEGFGLVVPVRRMREWAKDAKVEWAMDRKVAMPSDKEMAKMAIEDAGAAAILPGYDRAGGAHGAAQNDFPFLLNVTKEKKIKLDTQTTYENLLP